MGSFAKQRPRMGETSEASESLYASIPWAIGVIIICIIFQYIKSTYKCNHCGKEWGLSKIDEDIQDGYSKTEKVGNYYKTYRIQVVKETWRCSSCGNIVIRTRKDKKEI